MTIDEVKDLPLEKKFQIMEFLWDDLRSRFDTLGVSPETASLLDERLKRVREGSDTLYEWNEVKSTIGRP